MNESTWYLMFVIFVSIIVYELLFAEFDDWVFGLATFGWTIIVGLSVLIPGAYSLKRSDNDDNANVTEAKR